MELLPCKIPNRAHQYWLSSYCVKFQIELHQYFNTCLAKPYNTKPKKEFTFWIQRRYTLFVVTGVCNDCKNWTYQTAKRQMCMRKLTQGFSEMAAGFLSLSVINYPFNVAGTWVGIQVIPANSTGPQVVVPTNTGPPGSIPPACCGSPSGISGSTRSYKSSKFSNMWPANVKCTVKMLAVGLVSSQKRRSHLGWKDEGGGGKCRVKDKTHSAEKEGSS